jgi:predicted nuclease with TOPRIM domain
MNNDRFARELLGRFSEMLDASTKRVESRIDGLRAEFSEFRSATEASFDELAGHFAHLELRVDGLESRFDRLENRVGALETRLTAFETKVYLRFDAIDARFDILEVR